MEEQGSRGGSRERQRGGGGCGWYGSDVMTFCCVPLSLSLSPLGSSEGRERHTHKHFAKLISLAIMLFRMAGRKLCGPLFSKDSPVFALAEIIRIHVSKDSGVINIFRISMVFCNVNDISSMILYISVKKIMFSLYDLLTDS